MKTQRRRLFGSLAILCALPMLLAASSFLANQEEEPTAQSPAAAAREAIEKTYAEWARARVEYDRETMESILADDFYVLLYEQRITREKFLGDISEQRSGARLTRFDPAVLTVRPTEDGWVAVITEKLELEGIGPDGKALRGYSLWITRDGWREEDGNWVATFSEAIGHENWMGETKPPFQDW